GFQLAALGETWTVQRGEQARPAVKALFKGKASKGKPYLGTFRKDRLYRRNRLSWLRAPAFVTPRACCKRPDRFQPATCAEPERER
ncbi:MAG: hypothetical protein EBV72_14935, partial [Betaproteobacteria bacterium]|nr:hypothetical protein [Betaproteobacteria bacterium]